MANELFVIHPYREGGTWMFDDARVGLAGEPFVAGIPEMIERVTREQGIRRPEKGFTLIFSPSPFPGAVMELERVREEVGGNWYRWTATGMEGWLCPALFRYFDKAPERIYIQVKAKE